MSAQPIDALPWLTATEVQTLTDRQTWSAQARMLAGMGVPYRLSGAGRPLHRASTRRSASGRQRIDSSRRQQPAPPRSDRIMLKHYRQGDVLIREVREIPTGTTDITPTDRIVLAHGELTGHAHAIAPGQARELSLASPGATVRRFLAVVSAATVRHEEHAPIPLPAGSYEIVQQREYSPEEIRNVAD